MGVVEGVELDGGRKLRRFWTKSDLQDFLVPHRHQSVKFSCRILLPVRPRRQDDRTRLVDFPLAIIPAPAQDRSTAVRAPPMSHDFKIEAGRTTQVRLERKRLFLLVCAAQKPIERKSPRPEAHGYAGIFETSGRKLQTCQQTRIAQPVEVEDSAFACASRLDPA